MNNTPVTFTKVPTLSELRQTWPHLKALFFDMDGTLFNTESYHADAMLMIGAKYKIRPPHSAETVHDMMMGKADHLVFEIIKHWDGVPKHWTHVDFVNEKNENLVQIFQKVNPEEYFLPATLQLLKEAEKEGMFLALVTSSEKLVTEELIRIAEVSDYFHLVLTRDDCPLHKPDPWPYLKALELGKLEKSEVVIFEDSKVGLEAAVASGANVVKVGWY